MSQTNTVPDKQESVRLRRQMTGRGKRWTCLATLRDFKDEDGWRIVVERGHWQDKQERIRVKKYHPDGHFYFCEGLTLSMGAWEQLI